MLHRPTFESDLAEGKHHRDSSFAVVLLCVCACAARLSDDPRCYIDGSQDRDSAGWRWFNQMRFVPNTAFNPMTVSDLQVYAVCILSTRAYAHESSPTPLAIVEEYVSTSSFNPTSGVDNGWNWHPDGSGHRCTQTQAVRLWPDSSRRTSETRVLVRHVLLTRLLNI